MFKNYESNSLCSNLHHEIAKTHKISEKPKIKLFVYLYLDYISIIKFGYMDFNFRNIKKNYH